MTPAQLSEVLQTELDKIPPSPEQAEIANQLIAELDDLVALSDGKISRPALAMAKYVIETSVTKDNLIEAMQLLVMGRILKATELGGDPFQPVDLLRAIIHVCEQKLKELS